MLAKSKKQSILITWIEELITFNTTKWNSAYILYNPKIRNIDAILIWYQNPTQKYHEMILIRNCCYHIEHMHINQHVSNSQLELFIQFQSKDKMHEEKIASMENDLKVNWWSNQFERQAKPEIHIFFYEMKTRRNGFDCI